MLKVSDKFKGTQLWVDAINKFIRLRFKAENYGYLLICAFPMEYHGIFEILPDKNKVNFENRTKAMIKFYEKKLNAFPVENNNWLYRQLS